ncbi:MAG: hypothetical protein H6738_10680 [Alphaproteobacteria bacterium]|nr:hypothetical protein [Alphaproteobacteria bacterium]MCB9697235.1 hypothetical protein [Alphaproteobacteria bacterium]
MIATAWGVGFAAAAVLEVPGDHATVVDAVAAARSGDTISIAAGTWSGALSIDRTLTLVAAEGPGTVTLRGPDAADGAAVIRVRMGADLTMDGITVDGGGRHRVLWLEDDTTATVRKLALRGPANGDYGDGGAILVRPGASLVLEEPALDQPPRGFRRGGYIALAGASLVVRGGELRGGRADLGDGGAIFAFESSVDIEGVSFVDDVAFEAGGAISVVDGALTVTDATFAEGRAGLVGSANGVGGAIFAWGSPVEVRGTVFRDNAAVRGGAIELVDSPSASVVGSSFERNVAEQGGGTIDLASGAAEIRGAVICESSAPTGGVVATGGELLLDHTVISRSTGASGAVGTVQAPGSLRVVHADVLETTGTTVFTGATLTNTVVAWADGELGDVTADHAVFFEVDGVPAGQVVGDPSFVDRAPGDCVGDLRPSLGSPLIDAATGLDPDGSPADVGVYGGASDELLDADRDGITGPTDCDDDDPAVGACPEDTGQPQETGTPTTDPSPAPEPEDPRCGCASSGAAGAASLLPALLVGLRRRRRAQSCSLVPFRPDPS